MFVENYIHKFELKPGRFIFVPSKKCIARGNAIVNEVLSIWSPPEHFYHIGKRGGHVAAMRIHERNQWKCSVDISNFFGNVTRSKVKRALRKQGLTEFEAFELAYDSCVKDNGKKHLPYGFVQSMALATLVLDQSNLGRLLEELRYFGVRVSVYVDDIVLSYPNRGVLEDSYQRVVEVAEQVGFSVAEDKFSPPLASVVAFNCSIEANLLRITEPRMEQFREQLIGATDASRDAILRYVGVINEDQAIELS